MESNEWDVIVVARKKKEQRGMLDEYRSLRNQAGSPSSTASPGQPGVSPGVPTQPLIYPEPGSSVPGNSAPGVLGGAMPTRGPAGPAPVRPALVRSVTETQTSTGERLANWAFYLILAVIVLGSWAGIGVGYPVLGHGWRWPMALAGTVLGVVGSTWLWYRRGAVSDRGLLVSGATAMLLTFFFVVGATHSVVLGGRVYPLTSKTAQTYQLSHQLVYDFNQLSYADKLLAYNLTDAQAHFNAYQPETTVLQTILNNLEALNPNSLPDGRFLSIINDLKVAANYGQLGLTADYQLLQVTTDPTLSSEVTSDRGVMDSNTLAAWNALGPITQSLGFSLAGQVH